MIILGSGIGAWLRRYRQWALVGAEILVMAGSLLVAADQPVAERQGVATGHALPDRDAVAPPGEFPQGACVVFAPLTGNRHSTIFLDAGHGGLDSGALGSTAAGQSVQEKNLTLPVVLDAAGLLRADGYRVVVSRNQDIPVAALGAEDLMQDAMTVDGIHTDHLARTRCADVTGAAVLISVHFNAFGVARIGGTTTVYDPSRPFSAQNKKLASRLQQDVRGALAAHGWQVDDRGVIPDTEAGGPAHDQRGDNYGHLMVLGPPSPGYQDVPSMMPGALVEPLFITNPAEASIAASLEGQQAIAKGIVAATEWFAPGA